MDDGAECDPPGVWPRFELDGIQYRGPNTDHIDYRSVREPTHWKNGFYSIKGNESYIFTGPTGESYRPAREGTESAMWLEVYSREYKIDQFDEYPKGAHP